MLEWNDYLALLTIARNKSLYRAAREAGVAVSTMMRRIAQIEERAGAPLFHKTQAGYVPTPIGTTLLTKAEEMEALTQAAEQELQSAFHADQYKIHISASEVIAPFFVSRHLTTIKANFPEAHITLTTTEQSPSAVAEEFDISLWPSTPSNEDLFGRRLTKVKWAVFGGSSVATATNALEASQANIVQLFGRKGAEQIIPSGQQGDSGGPTLATNSLITAAALAASGGTTAYLPCILGCNFAGLKQLSPSDHHHIGELWAIYRKSASQRPLIRGVLDVLIDAAQQDQTLFLGD